MLDPKALDAAANVFSEEQSSERHLDAAEKIITAYLSALPREPSSASMGVVDGRTAFEEWAEADHRDIQPNQDEERHPGNYHYYERDSTNNAYIGWYERSCLTAAPSPIPAPGVVVKALEWPKAITRGQRVHNKPALVNYTIAHYGGDVGDPIFTWAEAHSPWSKPLPTYDAAKAGAQADFEQRVRSCLSPAKEERS